MVDEETKQLLRDGIALLSLLITTLSYWEQKRRPKKRKKTRKRKKLKKRKR